MPCVIGASRRGLANAARAVVMIQMPAAAALTLGASRLLLLLLSQQVVWRRCPVLDTALSQPEMRLDLRVVSAASINIVGDPVLNPASL